MKRLLFLIVMSIVGLADANFPSSVLAEPLTDAKFDELLKVLQPPRNEAWRTIPWKISLLDAQRIAAKENKPIFIWAMDGHPLGCT